ncbi:MAG: restriction endonuclease subunit S [Muribaculaceae bacterium]|nr:restriction endonuclease subunit S [Muribaculaceae bacterium]
MNHGWPKKRLGDICQINFGKRIVAKDTQPGPYYVYGGGGATFTTMNYNRENCMIISRFAMSPECVRFVRGRFFLNDSGLSVQSNKESLTQEFVDKYLWANQPRIYNLGRGAAQRNLNTKSFSDFPIPIPPMEVQEQIVGELDKLNELIELKRKQLKDLDTLAQSLFYETFGDPITNPKGWHTKSLANVCTVTSSNRIFADEYCDYGIPFYRGKEVSELSRGEKISVELFISQKRYEKLKASNNLPQIDDILITAVGTIGNIWVVNTSAPFYFKDGNIIWLKDIDFSVSNSKYFRFLLIRLIDIEKSKMANGSAYKALTIQNLKKLTILLPPLSIQEQFAERVEAIEEQKRLIESTIADLETLLASRMDYWFND